MPTLILPPRHSADSIVLWRTAVALGWEVERLPNWRVPGDFSPEEAVVYGEPLFAAAVAEALNLTLIGPTTNWLCGLPEPYLRRKLTLTTLQKARSCPRPAFIKTAEGGIKCFQAGVYHEGQDIPGGDMLNAKLPVLVGEVVEWEVEFRTFVKDRQVVASSEYMRDGELAVGENGEWWPKESSRAEMEQALGFADYFLSDKNVQMPPAFVLDVGRIKDRGWAVVEANDAYGAGICGCDPESVLSVLQKACLKDPTPVERIWGR